MPQPPVDLTATHEVESRGGVTVGVRRDWLEALRPADLLAGRPLRAWGAPVAHDLTGRAAVEVLRTPRGEIVAKRLSRGGLLGGLLRERFADPWRPAREAAVAEALAARGCETAPVVAWRATRRAPGLYELELASERVVGARDALAWLEAQGPSNALAAQLGRTLARLHDEGLRHRDLQVKNLLVPAEGTGAERCVVIDLDRCTLGGALDLDERIEALTRFARSLVKRGHLPMAPGDPRDPRRAGARNGVRAFLSAYGGGAGVPRSRLSRRVADRLARQVAWHRRSWGRPAGG